jgi:hypothetical protein
MVSVELPKFLDQRGDAFSGWVTGIDESPEDS